MQRVALQTTGRLLPHALDESLVVVSADILGFETLG